MSEHLGRHLSTAIPKRGQRTRRQALRDSERTIEELVEQHLAASHAALKAADRSLFFSLPVAFDPAESVGPYLAVVDRDDAGQPYRFLDMGALIATNAFGENDPQVVRAVLESRHLFRRATRIPNIRPCCLCASRPR